MVNLAFDRRGALEKELPDALFHAAALSRFLGPEEVVEALSEGYGPLSQEFKKASRRVRKGSPLGEALESIAGESGSPLVRQALQLLAEGLASGADVSAALKRSGEHARALQRVRGERQAIIAVEKYTLLLAGGLVVPLILGVMSSVVSGLPLEGGGEVAASALLGSQAYLVEYAVIASFFAAMLEDAPKKAVGYAVFLVPAALGLFLLAA